MSNETLDLIWGAANIAALLGVSERQAYAMLEKGELPAIKKNGKWVVSRRRLIAVFEGEAA